ncbi:hypothetical protein B0H13DRAFT_2659207 [Mycena leptocephala]|nr:hypothetical protein B0H13DRAFT_2659207 [Mycena leptocephala]
MPGVTPKEFEALLDFFYTEGSAGARSMRLNTIDGAPHRVSTTIDPIEQIVLAEKHDIPHWFRIAYVSICERGEPLEEWEARKIGFRKTTLLARARETVRNPIIRSDTTSGISQLFTPKIGWSPRQKSLIKWILPQPTRVDAIVPRCSSLPIRGDFMNTVWLRI